MQTEFYSCHDSTWSWILNLILPQICARP